MRGVGKVIDNGPIINNDASPDNIRGVYKEDNNGRKYVQPKLAGTCSYQP